MSFIIKWVSSHLNSKNYEPLLNQDLAKEQAVAWMERYSGLLSLEQANADEKIKEYVKSLIDDLKKFRIDFSNFSIVQTHLEKVAGHSQRLRNQILEKLRSYPRDENFISKIRTSLAVLSVQHP